MEIVGTILQVEREYIRIKTVKKNQEVDVFFPESKFEGIKWFYEEHMATRIEIEIQEFEVEEHKYGKLWMKHVISPKRNRLDQCNTFAAVKQRDKVAVLFRKQDLED